MEISPQSASGSVSGSRMRLVSEAREAMAHTDLYVPSHFLALASNLRPNGHIAMPPILFRKSKLMLTQFDLKSWIVDRLGKYATITNSSWET